MTVEQRRGGDEGGEKGRGIGGRGGKEVWGKGERGGEGEPVERTGKDGAE